MSRVIKFRAWNKKSNQMEIALLICFVNKYVDVLLEANLEGGSQESWSFNDIELMQFTGLLDKNGKEIYEGDILDENGCYFKVVWDTTWASFKLQWIGRSIQYPEWNRGILMEIIGNIYEHKHLLK